MRLEEYQRWLDAQFVEEADTPTSAVTAQDLAAEELTAAVGDGMAPTPGVGDKGRAPGAEEDASSVSIAAAQPASTPPEALEAATSLGGLDDLADELEVPSIERFLPHLGVAAAQAPAPSILPDAATVEADIAVREAPLAVPAPGEASAESPVERAVELEAGAGTATDQTVEGTPCASLVSEEPSPPVTGVAAAPVTEEPPAPATVSQVTSAESADAAAPLPADHQVSAGASADEPAGAAASGTGRRRRARNVRASEVVKELDPAELWQLAPQHIQRLLAVGEEKEVAQNSYSRRFKETRLELIQRLLDPTLSLEDTARLLNVCPATVRRYTNRGLLTHQRTPGDQRRFRLSDVLAFLEAQSRLDA